MDWTRRNIIIIYSTLLLLIFFVSGLMNYDYNIEMYQVTCENGTIERYNISDKYICGGVANPLRKNIIEINLSLIVERLNNN